MLALVDFTSLFAVLIAFTVAPGTLAPLGSITRPLSVARKSCALSAIPESRTARNFMVLICDSKYFYEHITIQQNCQAKEFPKRMRQAPLIRVP